MNETYRKISIELELERAIKYLRLGLAEVQRITPENDFYDPVFIYLSGGLERLFKIMLCLNHLEIHGRLPNSNEIWQNRNGHDLLFLKHKVEKFCVDIKIPFASQDYDLIVNNDFINRICKTLSEFGKRSRYFNLDAILGVEQEFDSKISWEKLETEINIEIYGNEKFYQLLSDPKQLEKLYTDSNREIVVRLERFLRALTRQFIFGNFYKDSKTFVFQIEDFTDIKDNQLGLTDYGKFKNHERIRRKN
ncbi:MAG TPA: hypothetical protein PKD87_14805 [Burkholderiaceae bacterium]|nr:hypothetical protein [Burkholderiaceae bacterium]